MTILTNSFTSVLLAFTIDDAGLSLLAVLAGLLLAMLIFAFSIRAGRRSRLMSDLPTSKTSGVFIGLVEVKGTAESESPLTSFLANSHCVWYSWTVDEHWSRTVTEHYTDSDGKSKTRTKHESGWKSVASGGDHSDFYLRDDEGVIRIMPDGAEIRPMSVFNETVYRSDPLYYEKGPEYAVSDSDHRRRFVERAISLHQPLYIIGQSRLRDDIVAPEIAHDDQSPIYLISAQPEESVVSGYQWQFWLLGILALVACLGVTIGIDIKARDPHYQPDQTLSAITYTMATLGFFTLAGCSWAWMVYNSLVGLKNRTSQAWSNVDVQLKRRSDLIPNIVRVIEAVTGHEADVQETVATLRSQAAATEPGSTGPNPEGCASRLIAVAESYPDLKADQNFLQLQDELINTENLIALARAYYNDIAMYYNNRREVVPDCWIASIVGMHHRESVTAENFERAAVQVKLID